MKNANDNACKARWQSLEAKTYSGRTSLGRVRTKKKKVSIEELPKSVLIPSDKDPDTPYGIPVDVTLAINLISDFQKLLPEKILERYIDGKKIVFDRSDDKDVDLLGKSINGLVDILRRSSAITIDKNVLLKTLSQPGCEGLRFYLCKKTEGDGQRKDGTDFLSLVTVGVDKDGKDHLYEYPDSPGGKSARTLKTLSLTSEYAHPPGTAESDKQTLREIYHTAPYVLLNYALDITEAGRKKNTVKRRKTKKRQG